MKKIFIDPEKVKEEWEKWQEGSCIERELSPDFNAGFIAGWHAAKEKLNES